jgi:hypothetical protein
MNITGAVTILDGSGERFCSTAHHRLWRERMTRRNSIQIAAEKVTLTHGNLKMLVTIREPDEDDLVDLLAQCSALLNDKRRRRDLKTE